MNISLIIGTKEEQNFKTFFKSLNVMQMPFELIICDISQKNFIQNYMSQSPKTLECFTIIQENPPLGFSKGYNKAFKIAKGEYVVWLNDDCELLLNWDIKAIEFMKNNKNCIGAIYFSEMNELYKIDKYGNILYANFGIIDKALGNKLGWFDERLQMYGSDTAISLNGLSHGYHTLAIPNCRINHNRTNIHHLKDIRKKDNKIFSKIYNPLYLELNRKISKGEIVLRDSPVIDQ